MPLINIETNQPLAYEAILKEISHEVAILLDKPECYVMLKYTHNEHMLFAGDNEPLAHIELKSLGLPDAETEAFSAELCSLMKSLFAIPAERVYIEFSSPPRHHWGWNNSTF